ncbi:MAG: abortive phage infection protein, partial [Clostridia bacterium]|nr:abortive phage infection protein [Clostridia bacterium]
IVCVESALFHYGYTDFTPREWSIAVPRAVSQSRLKSVVVPFKAYYIQPNVYELGKSQADFDGTILPIYDRDRTICDCFKYCTKLDNELFAKAVTAYANDNKKNLANLSKYAKELRVYKKVTEMMEVLING